MTRVGAYRTPRDPLAGLRIKEERNEREIREV